MRFNQKVRIQFAASYRIKIILGFLLAVVQLVSADQQEKVLLLTHQQQNAFALARLVHYNQQPAVAVEFETTDDLHFYADPQTAPSPDLVLTVSAKSDNLEFLTPLYPQASVLFDSTLNKPVGVYSGVFHVVVPIRLLEQFPSAQKIELTIQGIACTSQICLPPFKKTVVLHANLADWQNWPVLAIPDLSPRQTKLGKPSSFSPQTTPVRSTALGTTLMLLISVLAGLSFNIMPCVLPVLPLVIGRLTAQAGQHPTRRLVLGLAFCAGIVLFFTAIGIFSSLFRLVTGTVFNLNDPYRYPAFNILMASFLVLFALFLFDLLSIALPQSITSKNISTGTISGSVGMGVLAGILSIPCSGAIVAAVLIWTQTQSPISGLMVFLLMGVGMALPYALLVLIPSWLNFIPKPGVWMDYLKKSLGFVLLILAIKPLSGLPKEQLLNTLTFLVCLAFAAWVAASWVSYSMAPSKKMMVRLLAAAIVIIAGGLLLTPKPHLIDWQPYQRNQIQQAIQEGRTVLIKFTADWCTNCKILERRVFADPNVAKILKQKNILPVMADTTLADMPGAVDLKTVYNVPGAVPLTVIHRAGKPDPIYLFGIYSKADLFEALQ